MRNLFYFRGISTRDSDDVYLGPLGFGPMHARTEKALTARGWNVNPVLNMGSGSIAETAERAWNFIKSHPVWLDSNEPVQFVGHSAGGLVARYILGHREIPQGKVANLLTIATPHAGTSVADFLIQLRDKNQAAYWKLRALGIDTHAKSRFFTDFSPEGVRGVFKSEKSLQASRVGSIICECESRKLSWPLKAIHTLIANSHYIDLPSDGLIECSTQKFGDRTVNIEIDHLQQMGFFNRSQRFENLCDEITRQLLKN